MVINRHDALDLISSKRTGCDDNWGINESFSSYDRYDSVIAVWLFDVNMCLV